MLHTKYHPKTGVGNLSRVAGQKQTLQRMAGRINFHHQFRSLCCC